jgi:hypothetical protein
MFLAWLILCSEDRGNIPQETSVDFEWTAQDYILKDVTSSS